MIFLDKLSFLGFRMKSMYLIDRTVEVKVVVTHQLKLFLTHSFFIKPE